LNGLDAIGLDYFISAYYYKRTLCVVVLVFWRRTRGRQTRPQIWDLEANANCPQILLHTQEIRGKIVAASGHLEVKNCTKIHSRRGSAPDLLGGAYSAPPEP